VDMANLWRLGGLDVTTFSGKRQKTQRIKLQATATSGSAHQETVKDDTTRTDLHTPDKNHGLRQQQQQQQH